MKKLEVVLWAIVVLALVMKVLALPLNSLLLIIGLSTLSIVYFMAGWYMLPRPQANSSVLAVCIGAGLIFSLATIGILFKLQLWPLSAFFLLLSSTGTLALLVTAFVMRSWGEDVAATSRALLVRSVPLFLVCFGLYLLPGGALTAFYYRDRPDIAPLMIKRNASSDPGERERLTARIDSIEEVRLRRDIGEAP